MKIRRLHIAPFIATRRMVNAGESHSVVASETTEIARALSLLAGHRFRDESQHPGNLTLAQARDVIAWAGVP